MVDQTSQDNTNLVKPRLLAGLGLLALSIISGQPAMTAESETLCWRDYPIPTDSVNYAQAFVSETLVPDRILINGKVVKPGMTESNLNSILGLASEVVEDWRQRTDQEQCKYLLELLRKHPNSMHLYKNGELKWKKMSGFFRISEWVLPTVGTLHAFFYKSSTHATESSYLYHLTLLPAPLDKVKRKKGPGYILIRTGAPNIQWNIEENIISIISTSNDY
jgi:hypothetical protein